MVVNKQLKFAICDDLQQEREKICTMVNTYIYIHHYIATIDEFSSGEELLSADYTVYDLIILDIFMGDLNGIQTANELMNSKASAKVIFCSTSNEFAAESYEVNALRYLTKPVDKEKLFQTLDRYFHAYTAMKMLTYKCNRMEEHILLSDVLWIEADKHKCILHTIKGDIITTTTFAQFCEQLETMDFIKPIRYALVPLRMIVAVPTNELKLRDGTIIPIGRKLRQEVKDAYMDYKMKKLLWKGEIQ